MSKYNENDAATHNYIYDEIGQLIEDKSEGLKIVWRVDGKVKKVMKNTDGNPVTISFGYDGLGNRISKSVATNFGIIANPISKTTYYVRDAQGNELAVYTLNQTSTAKSMTLREHDIYGSSRLGLEDMNLLVYKNELPNTAQLKSSVSKVASTTQTDIVADASTNKTAATLTIQPLVALSPVPVIRDYSLSFDSSTVATWPIQTSTVVLANPESTNIHLDTKFSLKDSSIPEGNYAIGQFEYKGVAAIASKTDIPLVRTTTNCITVNNTSVMNVVNVSRLSNCNETDLSFGQVLNQNEEGFVEYNARTGLDQSGIKVGFAIDNKFYGFITRIVVKKKKKISSNPWYNELDLFRIDNGGDPVDLGAINSTQTIKMERLVVGSPILRYSVDGAIVYETSTVSTNAAILTTSFENKKTYIEKLRVNKKVIVNKKLTTQVLVSVTKDATGYRPAVIVAQTLNETASTVRSYNKVATNSISQSDIQKGITLNLDTDFGTGSASFIVNGAIEAASAVWNAATSTAPLPAVQINGINKLGGSINGGNSLGFDMCYLNYTIKPLNDVANSQSFSFDDATSKTVTNNPPASATGTIMTVSPSVQRTLTALCMADTDGDGILDIYEDLNLDDNLASDDTDQDGTPNYLDTDDDGDGLLTIFEGADPDGDHNPITGTPSWNTNATTGPNQNTVPNYLDNDDDGDGLFTQYEGADPDGDQNPAKGGTSLDTDGDAQPNYLDIDDDGDGLYTNFENVDPDGDHNPLTGIQSLNTDHFTERKGNVITDLVPNYLDNDDDGDSVLTIWEGADPDGDHNPTAGLPSLNTDAVAGNNPNMLVDTIPNYLDKDDDGDGYATWEEGPDPDKDGNPNTGATQDVDVDGIHDYIDYSDIIYPALEAIKLNNYVNLVGDKRYELANHLGNVLVVVTDKKIPMFITDAVPSSGLKSFNADVLSYNDYYPFGMLVPNRHGNSTAYRYGFNGMEKDDELKGEGNSYDFGARLYDPRVGRWFKMDAEFSKLPNLSPYGYVNNNPLLFIDPDGNFLIDVHKRITRNAFSKVNGRYLSMKQQKAIIAFRNGIVGNGVSYYDGSVVAPDVRSLPWYAGGFGKKSVESDHFDSMNYKEILANFEGTMDNIETALYSYKKNQINAEGLAKIVGEEYHAVQDFYSHSNFIEIYKDVYGETKLSDIPTLQEAMSQDKYKKFAGKLQKELKTGIYPGTDKDSHKQMNHDLGAGSTFGSVEEVKGKEVNWNSRAAEAVATKATKKVNDKVEQAILTK
ncbi:RHS repeat-associated core domain-containing protein [Flavobacterium sp. DSP2-3-1]|uniref:RHS repeat-associated core domain-containing protein n=1 Tax=Flavobacterium sp. DSP2-3-1 TaxID=2804620 RepID=UPI003CFB5482